MLFMLSIVILYYFPYLIDYRYNDIYIYLSFFPISLLILCYTIRLDSKVHFCQSCRSAIKSTIELNMCHKIDYRMRQFSCNFDKLKVIFFSTTVVVFFLSLHTHTLAHTDTQHMRFIWSHCVGLCEICAINLHITRKVNTNYCCKCAKITIVPHGVERTDKEQTDRQTDKGTDIGRTGEQ